MFLTLSISIFQQMNSHEVAVAFVWLISMASDIKQIAYCARIILRFNQQKAEQSNVHNYLSQYITACAAVLFCSSFPLMLAIETSIGLNIKVHTNNEQPKQIISNINKTYVLINGMQWKRKP